MDTSRTMAFGLSQTASQDTLLRASRWPDREVLRRVDLHHQHLEDQRRKEAQPPCRVVRTDTARNVFAELDRKQDGWGAKSKGENPPLLDIRSGRYGGTLGKGRSRCHTPNI